MTKTSIEYLDFTSNPIVGCDMSLPCAERCWARRMARRLKACGMRGYENMVDSEGRWTGRVVFHQAEFLKLARRKKPAVVGLCFMADAFRDEVPDDWLDQMFGVVAWCSHLKFILPTKRVRRLRQYSEGLAQLTRQQRGVRMVRAKGYNVPGDTPGGMDWPLPNLALMLSASNQAELDARMPDFLATPTALRVLSLEPMVGAVDPGHVMWGNSQYDALTNGKDNEGGRLPHFDWVICGGESGPGARPMVPEWPRKVRDDCVAAGVPFTFKQWGEWSPAPYDPALVSARYADVPIGDGTHHRMFRVGKKATGRVLDGKVWDQRPEGWG